MSAPHQPSKPPVTVASHNNDENFDAFDIISTEDNSVIAVVGEFRQGELIPHQPPAIRHQLRAKAESLALAYNLNDCLIKTLTMIAEMGDLTTGTLANHPLRHLMVQLSGQTAPSSPNNFELNQSRAYARQYNTKYTHP